MANLFILYNTYLRSLGNRFLLWLLPHPTPPSVFPWLLAAVTLLTLAAEVYVTRRLSSVDNAVWFW